MSVAERSETERFGEEVGSTESGKHQQEPKDGQYYNFNLLASFGYISGSVVQLQQYIANLDNAISFRPSLYYIFKGNRMILRLIVVLGKEYSIKYTIYQT